METSRTSERARQISVLFSEVVDLDPEERTAYLDQVCRDDADLCREVEAFLAAFDARGADIRHDLDQLFLPSPDEDAGPSEALIGQRVSHYQIQEKLGGGGMGAVYKAHDTHLDRTVALKFLPPDLTRDPEARNRFIHEARAASALDHVNICTIYETGETDGGRTFIAMACYDGETLKAKIERGPLPLDEAIDYTMQMAEGLNNAHGAGIIHRDIKPANVLVTEEGVVKIVDFGLAKVRDVSLTQTGRTLGTIAYMSPEQSRGETVDHRSDIWSLGVVLYEMLTGKRPFRGHYDQAVIYSILNQDPEPMREVRPEVPQAMAQIVEAMLSKEASARYQYVDELQVDLQSVGREFEVGGPEVKTVSSRRSRRAMLFSGVVVLVLVLVALGVFVARQAVGPEGRTTPSASAPSIAVLPLKNTSGDPDQVFFADGMTEELITTLTRIEGLSPISPRSVRRFKGSEETIPEIARLVGVDYVVDGSVLQAEGRVRITVGLYDGSTDTPLWGERYEREHRDVLALQQEVALAIAREIEVVLTPQDAGRLAIARKVDPEAHRLYLESRSNATGESSDIDLLKSALEIDPDYALAYGALAEAYVVANIRGLLSSEEAVIRAKEAAEKALALDPMIAEAHTALGEVSAHYEWDWDAAVQHFERALASNPGYARVHWRHAGHLVALRRFDESLAESRRAQELDPPGYSPMGYNSYRAGRYDQAIHSLQKHLDLSPHDTLSRVVLGQAYLQNEMYEEGIAELEQAGGAPGIPRLVLAWGYAVVGRISEARKNLDEAGDQQEYISPYYSAAVHAALGEADQAVALLEQAYEKREANLIWVNVEQAFDPLRSDPRFEDLLRRMGFSPTEID